MLYHSTLLYENSVAIIGEFCDRCNTKLSIYRTYYNGRKICSACYGKENIKNDKKQESAKLQKCPNCGYQL